MTHNLKIAPDYYNDVLSGRKQFELRINDRDYHVGDTLILQEFCVDDAGGTNFTGRSVTKKIGYILENCRQYGLMDGFCVLGFGGDSHE